MYKVTYPTVEKTRAAAYVSTDLAQAVMMYPITQIRTMSDKPWGRPHVSRIFASGSLVKPPMMEDTMLTAALVECLPNELVTYGLSVRVTTSAVDVAK